MKPIPYLILLLASFICSSFAQEVSNSIDVTTGRTTSFIMIDSFGRRVGVNPVAHIEYKEIPGASYGQDGVDSEDSSVADIKNNALSYPGATSGSYLLRAFGGVQSSLPIGIFLSRGINGGRDFYLNGATDQHGIAEFMIIYNTDTTAALAAYQLTISPKVKGGVFNPTGGTLSVKAKPAIGFGSGDTLRTLIATVRWLTSYNISLGTVSSPSYNVTKWDSVTVVGNYSYQKFRTTTPKALSWAANNEYELFTVGLPNYSGIENFDLTNSIGVGQWYVEIDSTDYSDTSFYQGTATGFAYQNKSASNMATWDNSQRHVVKAGGKLHEAYNSGGEIIYRRSTGLSSPLTWEVTNRVTTGNGSNSGPCIASAHNNCMHLVWEWMYSTTRGKVMYARSTDNGSSWSAPTTLVDNDTITSTQGGALWPVIAERNSTQLVIVYCTSTGPKSKTSSDNGQTWSAVVNMPANLYGYEPYVWSLSLTPVSDKLSLTYDYRYFGAFSRIYNGSTWSRDTCVNAGTGTVYDRFSSVAVGVGPAPIAAWCAQKYAGGHLDPDYRILWRQGTLSNTWGWFIEFPKDTTISNYYPSIALMRTTDTYVSYHRSNTQTKVVASNSSVGIIGEQLLSSSGQWSNITQQTGTSDNPYVFWTDQAASPYAVQYWTGRIKEQLLAQTGGLEQHRRVGLQSQVDQSTLTYEVSPIKIVATTGEITLVPFKTPDLSKDLNVTMDNVWDYLGTDTYVIPSNAKSLIVDVSIDAQASQDTTGKKGANSFTTRSFRIDVVKGTQTVHLLTDQVGVSGSKQVDVTQFAGQAIRIRPVGVVPSSLIQKVTVGVGDVYVQKSK